ncbi:hypothetical protein BGW38_010129, partial [Lunasporangiospora selenospora]
TYLSTEQTYEFTDEQAQSDMEQLLRNLIQDGDAGDAALDYAIFRNDTEIAEMLLLAGSIISMERLDMLTLTPTAEMSSLLQMLC